MSIGSIGSSSSDHPETAKHPRSLLAGFLSYLVPGLGQIYQGRIKKGLLFFVCLYGLFFFGMDLGYWSNVYLVNERPLPKIVLMRQDLPGSLAAVGHRPQFAGQFWIGIAAWPAIWQYVERDKPEPFFGNFQRVPDDRMERMLNEMQKNGNKMWDLAWVYTVIAGVLNILVIYDAFAGPAFGSMGSAPRVQEEAVPS